MSVNSLPAVAVLHGFMARHPELQAVPISWVVNGTDGINGGMPNRDPDIARVAELIATALGVEVTGEEYDLDGHGRLLARFVRGEVDGITFFFGSYAAVEDGGA